MLGEELGHFCLDRLRQQGARSVAQHLGERVGKRPWLKQLDDGSIGHGVSLLCWRSGGANTPTIRRLLPLSPSPTSANSSGPRIEIDDAYIGGERPGGGPGRGRRGPPPFVTAVETTADGRPLYARLQVVRGFQTAETKRLCARVEAGTTIVSDGGQ